MHTVQLVQVVLQSLSNKSYDTHTLRPHHLASQSRILLRQKPSLTHWLKHVSLGALCFVSHWYANRSSLLSVPALCQRASSPVVLYEGWFCCKVGIIGAHAQMTCWWTGIRCILSLGFSSVLCACKGSTKFSVYVFMSVLLVVKWPCPHKIPVLLLFLKREILLAPKWP